MHFPRARTQVWPIMGAGYHTIHHTTYKHNYGHYFIFIDWLYGTCVTPEEYELAGAQHESEEAQWATAATASGNNAATTKAAVADTAASSPVATRRASAAGAGVAGSPAKGAASRPAKAPASPAPSGTRMATRASAAKALKVQ